MLAFSFECLNKFNIRYYNLVTIRILPVCVCVCVWGGGGGGGCRGGGGGGGGVPGY